MIEDLKEKALAYHAEGRPGKIEITPTKPTETQRDLSLAYTPGVAEPCREIAQHSSAALASNSIFDGSRAFCMAGRTVTIAAHAAL